MLVHGHGRVSTAERGDDKVGVQLNDNEGMVFSNRRVLGVPDSGST